jgi:hypothetical protein
VIKDRSGTPIRKVPDQTDRVESFGSWMTTADWDDDGDLDILVGTFDGMILLRRNEGSRWEPAYATGNEWVKVGAKPLRVPGGAHANPVIADWDGDGRWDIITGAADGVYWYRNIGQRGQPEFEAPVALVPRHHPARGDGVRSERCIPHITRRFLQVRAATPNCTPPKTPFPASEGGRHAHGPGPPLSNCPRESGTPPG